MIVHHNLPDPWTELRANAIIFIAWFTVLATGSALMLLLTIWLGN